MSAGAASMLIMYALVVVAAGIGLFIVEWWDAKTNPNWRLTAAGLLGRIFLAMIPIINILVAAGCAIHLVTEIMPSIVLFGKKGNSK